MRKIRSNSNNAGNSEESETDASAVPNPIDAGENNKEGAIRDPLDIEINSNSENAGNLEESKAGASAVPNPIDADENNKEEAIRDPLDIEIQIEHRHRNHPWRFA